MTTVSQIIDNVLNRLSELSTANPVHWTRLEILDHVNEAITELNLITGELQLTTPVGLNTTDNIYTLPDSVIAPLAVYVNNKFLHKQSIDDLDAELEWEATSNTASVPRIWCALGTSMILVSPRALATAQVTVLTQPDPAPDAAQSTGLPDEYSQLIEDYCVSRAHFKEGGAEFQQSLADYSRFLEAAQQLAGRDIFERGPSWEETPKTQTSRETLRGAAGE